MARLKQDASRRAQLYRAMGYDVAGAERVATAWHQRYDALGAGHHGTGERRMVEDSATRADERLGELIVGRAVVKADFEQIAARYAEAKQGAGRRQRPGSPPCPRNASTALTAMQAAGGSDIALNQARVAESGQLGAQIESLSEQLARARRHRAGHRRLSRTRSTAPSPHRSGCASTRSCTTRSCTPGPTSPAARSSAPPTTAG